MSIDPEWIIPEWHAPGAGALMTTRAGGHSSGPYASMNLHAAGGDDVSAVSRNRERLRDACGAQTVFLRQVHGSRVVRLDRRDAVADATAHDADASITTAPGVACVIQVADCLPVLFAAPEGRAVGAAHAGWRGLAAGVLENTVAALCEAAECPPSALQAWLGPCIGPARFQVGADVLEAFGATPPPAGGRPGQSSGGVGQASLPPIAAPEAAAAPRFTSDGRGKWLANLPLLARDRLMAAGLQTVSGGRWCTVSDPSRFFSYRRDGVTGRMAAAVWLQRGG